jgi:hypothetical protein
MASRFARANARANRVFMERLSDGLCTFHPGEDGRPDVPDVPYQFDNSFEVFDESGLSMRVRAMLLPVDLVGDVKRGASVTIADKEWHYSRTIEDDGYFVRFEVT